MRLINTYKNDHRYWEKPIKLNPVDKNFSLYEGRPLSGCLNWNKEASNGTTSGRERPIELETYKLAWNNYSSFSPIDSEFRYLCVRV